MDNFIGILNDSDQERLNQLIEGLVPGQLLWVSGYLAGLSKASLTLNGNRTKESKCNAIPAANPVKQSEKITVLYGTHTGHSEDISKNIQEKGSKLGLDIEIELMEDFRTSRLTGISKLLIVVSTHGEGEAPNNAVEFLEYLQGNRAAKLEHLNYAVLALGDLSYKEFCQTGIDFHNALSKLGGKAIRPVKKCDVDYEKDAKKWSTDMLNYFLEQNSAPQTKLQNSTPQTLSHEDTVSYNRKNPYYSKVLKKQVLNGRGSKKEVYHIELSLGDSGLSYEPGDALGIYSDNPPLLVEQILEFMKWDKNQAVKVNTLQLTLYTALRNQLEITTLNRVVLQEYNNLVKSESLEKLLKNSRKAEDYLHGHDLLDLLKDYPANITAQALVSLLRKLPPRLYSIASSMKYTEGEVHITLAAVRYENRNRKREGACSTYIADRIKEDEQVPVFIEKNKGFKLPEAPDAPIIMIGPGTGVAPFRAFLQELEIKGIRKKSWLFFGDQHFFTDFLYQTEWQKLIKKNYLERIDLAFSRDQKEKIYVQHRMKERSQELWDWIKKGAYIYVCGDKSKMASDVHLTLLDIIKSEGRYDFDKASDFLKELKRKKRYQLDVY